MNAFTLPLRLSRLRQTDTMRQMLTETRLSPSDFIAPIFVHATLQKKAMIPSMPGQFQWPLFEVLEEVASLWNANIRAVMLFGIPETKDPLGENAQSDDGIIQKTVRLIKQHYPDMLVITDLCFCEYTDHGHCGLLKENTIDTEKTLNALARQAESHAKAGADWIAPSGMVDGMVKVIRQALDTKGYSNRSILSYSVKYCSSLYGPFRDAVQSSKSFGHRKGYQMNPANQKEAVREARLDIEEGADLIMVKPATFYLDIIHHMNASFPEIPLAAYQVSGEYSMIKQAAKIGLFKESDIILESLLAIKRAGARCIITYFAKEVAHLLT